jgi:hypothetical protein
VEFRGFSAALAAIAQVFRYPGVFLRIALLWSLVHVIILLAYCAYIAATGHESLALALQFLDTLPGLQAQSVLTAIPNTLSTLAVTILWTRFVISGTRPSRWIQVPKGSARYMSRSILIGFGAVLGLVPGLIAARVFSGFIPERFASVGAITLIGLDALVVLYVCLRLWLVFPAIAMGDASITFARSFTLTKEIAFGLLLGSAIPFLGSFVVSFVIELGKNAIPSASPFIVPIALGVMFLSEILVLAANAAVAGIAARAYEIKVLQAQKA